MKIQLYNDDCRLILIKFANITIYEGCDQFNKVQKMFSYMIDYVISNNKSPVYIFNINMDLIGIFVVKASIEMIQIIVNVRLYRIFHIYIIFIKL